jgi:DNA-binding response OmpR family regulator
MPELDGLQVVEALREQEQEQEQERPWGRHLPVIALTARTRPEDRARRIAAGMDEFVTKPNQAATLQAAISRVILLRSDRPELPLISAAVLLSRTHPASPPGACGKANHPARAPARARRS